MADNSNSSFIPKSPVRGSSRPRPVKRLYLISIVASVFFVSTVLASGGIFVYTLVLQQDMQEQQERLAAEREAFDQSDMEQVLEFEERLAAANQILNQQVYLPALFTALESTALESTTYTGFSYEKPNPNNIVVTLETSNPTFDGVIFQREVLASNEVLQEASIVDVSYGVEESTANETGQVVESSANNISFTIEHSPSGALLQSNQPAAPAQPAAPVISEETVNSLVASSSASSTNEIEI